MVKENDVGGAGDVPCAWVIQIDSMTVAKAREIGRLLGQHGVTGRFVAGEIAENMREFAKIRKQMQGGE